MYRSHTEIEFATLDLSLTLPSTIKCHTSAVEAIWLSYDHFSDYSPSFEIPQYTQLYKGLGKFFLFSLSISNRRFLNQY